MDSILRRLDFVYGYIDDELITSRDSEEHAKHLHIVLQKLNDTGITINLSKCSIGATQVSFLGHQKTKEGTRPLPTKVEAIQQWKKPETIRELRRFPGVINFYQRFVKNAASIQAPLNEYLKDSKRNDKREIA